ncbi:MAG: hypothetical protein JSS87_00405 [Acidobacteria bacterium]|nr:hypothetical protein [Acidobacteriota bacterium]
MNPVTITTLTSNAVQQNLKSDGLDTLGLTTLALSTRWSDATPAATDYNSNELILGLGSVRAPFRGILEFCFTPAKATLKTALTDSATTLVVDGGGDAFPSPVGGPVMLRVATDSGDKVEILTCTARSGDSFTVTRGAQESKPQAFDAGTLVELLVPMSNRTSRYLDASGAPLTGTCAALRLHPAAVWRQETLISQRYGISGQAPILPVPITMVIRNAEGYTSARWYEPDEDFTGLTGPISFHDNRGLIVDPIYVASLFADLQAWHAGLTGKTSTSSPTGAGGVGSIAALASGTLLHVVTLHGAPYQPAVPAATLVTKNGSGTETGTVPASGLLTLNSGDGVEASTTDAGRLRWGWATNGVLARTRLVPPALPGTGSPAPSLPRQFYRVAVVDTVWSLLGNRTTTPALGVEGDDGSIASDLLPQVRDQVVINHLVDGPDTLAAADTVLTRAQQNMVLAVSPVIDGAFTVPTQVGANAHWPAFPALAATPPGTSTSFATPPASPKDGITAAWTSGQDVVVTIAADKAPHGAHVRIYPQQFVTLPAITAEPSFLRGDGGAAIAQVGQPAAILLRNPFQLAPAQPKPPSANLTMDIVIAPRVGNRKMWGAVSVSVSAGPASLPADSFAGTNPLSAMLGQFESVSPSPYFGIPATVTPPGAAPGGVTGFVRSLASEQVPRQGPRLPSMARFETVLTTGTGDGSGPLAWEAVLTGGSWARETRSAMHSSGNPGNPAAQDLHAPGVHVSGALAYDLARHAMRRAQSIIPLPTSPGVSPGWLVAMDGNNFNPPSDTVATNTGIGALLETVAADCETPELALVPQPAPGTTLQSLVNSLASAIGVPAPGFSAGNEARMIIEVRQEIAASAKGLRDSLWSLRRALAEAREFIYIESPQFARTARPEVDPAPANQIDLVDVIAKNLHDNPNLKVIVCTPRGSDFSQSYKAWSRQHYAARAEAVSNILFEGKDRVAVFHPVGFPGRDAHIKTTTVVVDDVWMLTGATHFRRRGMTFDGSAAISCFDRTLQDGYSAAVRNHRRNLMAAKLGIAAPGTLSPSAEWLRLGHGESAFQLVIDWLAQGGLGAILPLWPGPSDSSVLPASDRLADPDGTSADKYLALFGSIIAELGD